MTEGAVQVYAVGRLVFLTTKTLDLSRGLSVLLDSRIAQFANSNPEIAPYGRAAQQALENAGIFDKVKAKLVTAQTVTQAVQFTLTSADAGFVNKSALYSTEMKPWNKEGVYWFEVDQKLYAPIQQGFVVMKSASPAASAFARFLVSPEAKAVFAAFGYGAP
jgi:molybdate transport system substrate-binding protein